MRGMMADGLRLTAYGSDGEGTRDRGDAMSDS